MAEVLADGLSRRPIARIVSSPLSRCVDTARPLAHAAGLPVETDARLLEFDFGAYESRPKKDLGLKLRESHAYRPVPDGEALIDVWKRVGQFLDVLASCNHDEIAVVGHFWTNRMIFGHISRMDFETACRSRSYRPRTGSVAHLNFHGSCVARYRR